MIFRNEIYEAEINKTLNSIVSFVKATSKIEEFDRFYFKFSDFRFYKKYYQLNFAQKKTKTMLESIFIKLIEYYKIPSQELDYNHKINNIFFVFQKNNKRIGFLIDEVSRQYFDNEETNGIVKACNIDEMNIILFQETFDLIFALNNGRYKENGIKCKEISLLRFVEDVFGIDEMEFFDSKMKEYATKVNEALGIKTIDKLTGINHFNHKQSSLDSLQKFNYDNYSFQFINPNNEFIRKTHIQDYKIETNLFKKIKSNYLEHRNCLGMISNNDYSTSFLTSEWLYNSLKGCANIDFTAIISGYLKSIEQLLFFIIKLNADKGFKIALSNDKKIQKKAADENVTFYPFKKKTYIDLTSSQIEYANSQLGSSIFFIRNNKNIFIDDSLNEPIANMVDCFKNECRNGYFHTHNLSDWRTVEITRENAIYLYFLLLGSLVFPHEKEKLLNIKEDNSFDVLCEKIIEFKKAKNNGFLFEYSDGKKLDLLQLFENFEDYKDGEQHYKNMVFISSKPKHAFDDEEKILLTINNLPLKIYGKYRNGDLERLL